MLGCDKTSSSSSSSPSKSHNAWGTLTITRDGVATKVDFDGCWSGQLFGFYGVEAFHDPDTDKRVRVVLDPVTGPHVLLREIVAGMPRVAIDPATCTTFDAHVERTNNTLNDIYSVLGALKLSCSVPSVGDVVAEVTFNDCSFDNRAKSL